MQPSTEGLSVSAEVDLLGSMRNALLPSVPSQLYNFGNDHYNLQILISIDWYCLIWPQGHLGSAETCIWWRWFYVTIQWLFCVFRKQYWCSDVKLGCSNEHEQKTVSSLFPFQNCIPIFFLMEIIWTSLFSEIIPIFKMIRDYFSVVSIFFKCTNKFEKVSVCINIPY